MEAHFSGAAEGPEEKYFHVGAETWLMHGTLRESRWNHQVISYYGIEISMSKSQREEGFPLEYPNPSWADWDQVVREFRMDMAEVAELDTTLAQD
ncbi:hypothetical protein RJZ90_001220 [Blastomyces dermatitidis]